MSDITPAISAACPYSRTGYNAYVILDSTIRPSVFRVPTGALITYDRAFNHGEKSGFHAIIVAEGKSLLEYVDLQADTERKFEIALKRFQAPRKHAVRDCPGVRAWKR
jgi:hypothetical protein